MVSSPSVQPDDTIAVKYPTGGEYSGAAMMVISVGPRQPRANSTQSLPANGAHPEVAGYYDLTVIDSTDSFHPKNGS